MRLVDAGKVAVTGGGRLLLLGRLRVQPNRQAVREEEERGGHEEDSNW